MKRNLPSSFLDCDEKTYPLFLTQTELMLMLNESLFKPFDLKKVENQDTLEGIYLFTNNVLSLGENLHF